MEAIGALYRWPQGCDAHSARALSERDVDVEGEVGMAEAEHAHLRLGVVHGTDMMKRAAYPRLMYGWTSGSRRTILRSVAASLGPRFSSGEPAVAQRQPIPRRGTGRLTSGSLFFPAQ